MKLCANKKTTNRILLYCILVVILTAAGASFAWYVWVVRAAESEKLTVMKPYYLTVLDHGGTAALNLTIGSLYPGETKEIVFCVSNRNTSEGMKMGISDFDYILELVRTENLALQYSLFSMEKKESADEADYTIKDGADTYYWKKDGQPLVGSDVSEERQQQAELPALPDIVNDGAYFSYDKDNLGSKFHLKPETAGDYKQDYYLLQVKWDDSKATEFDKYLKETDMIYILVKALQPEPRPVDGTTTKGGGT